mmetsp:Transcript_19274/g.25112  ORF Transcript_19274/g.25112 Transcript_19274/m.25112 type:complete len:571 (+) Transcript_19274:99-1811(+)
MKIDLVLTLLLASRVEANPTLKSLGLDGTRVKHLIVLMMENHSFDNILGWLKQQNPEIDGLTGNECNYVDPTDPTSEQYCVTDQGALVDPDPDHSLDGTGWEIYGTEIVDGSSEHDPNMVTMGGFIATEAISKGQPDFAPQIMDCISPDHVPILSTLANEFVLFDKFYAGVPGPTFPNRLFSMSATSDGYSTNDMFQTLLGWPQSPLYESLDEVGADWRIYFNDLPTPWLFRKLRSKESLERTKRFETFETDVAAGDLPAFTWIDPAYFDLPEYGRPASDQHPSHDVSQGEILIKKVYETLRNSPLWNESALMITYDEHGGFYDHVPTPVNNIPSPDGIPCRECNNNQDDKTSPMSSFNFTRLGIRVPTIIASPWVEKGVVIHEPLDINKPQSSSRYELSSIPSTIKKMFNISHFLNDRDEWAVPFDHVWENNSLVEPRTDCLLTLPEPYIIDASMKKPNSISNSISNSKSLQSESKSESNPFNSNKKPLSDLQYELLFMLEGVLSSYDQQSESDQQTVSEKQSQQKQQDVIKKVRDALEAKGVLESETAGGIYAMETVQKLYNSLNINL